MGRYGLEVVGDGVSFSTIAKNRARPGAAYYRPINSVDNRFTPVVASVEIGASYIASYLGGLYETAEAFFIDFFPSAELMSSVVWNLVRAPLAPRESAIAPVVTLSGIS